MPILNWDVGPDGQGRPLVDGEVAGEDVAEVGRGLGADGVQVDGLAAGERVRLDVDAWNRRLLERYWTSMAGMYSGESKPSPTRSPGVEDDADAEVTWPRAKVVPAGLEVAAGVDGDFA